MNDDVSNKNDLGDENDNIRDDLDEEAEALLREIKEDNENFENEIIPKINKLGDGVNVAAKEMEGFQKDMDAVVEEASKKSDILAQKIEESEAEPEEK